MVSMEVIEVDQCLAKHVEVSSNVLQVLIKIDLLPHLFDLSLNYYSLNHANVYNVTNYF
ncbi:hypothetical protein Sjap_016727 [Stephania japonica]|uniref:Uncharacterized protein n=1 Tax=Stephania japonica TaxID=461633 RepID=A0AAP0IME3_9MAGN